MSVFLHRRVVQRPRRGVSVVQTAVVLALIAIVVITSVSKIGTKAKTKLKNTATGIGNPASLPSQFGS